MCISSPLGRDPGPYLVVSIVVHVAWEGETWGQGQLSFQHFWFDEFLQVGPAESPVPLISDMASVHDLTKEVAQVIIGDLRDGKERKISTQALGWPNVWTEREPQDRVVSEIRNNVLFIQAPLVPSGVGHTWELIKRWRNYIKE